jgi:hypothetical protein
MLNNSINPQAGIQCGYALTEFLVSLGILPGEVGNNERTDRLISHGNPNYEPCLRVVAYRQGWTMTFSPMIKGNEMSIWKNFFGKVRTQRPGQNPTKRLVNDYLGEYIEPLLNQVRSATCEA